MSSLPCVSQSLDFPAVLLLEPSDLAGQCEHEGALLIGWSGWFGRA